MANNKSANKRIRQTEKRRLRNRLVIGAMRTAVKRARVAIDEKAENAADLIRSASRKIDKAVSKGALRRTTASRYISRLTNRTPAE